MRKYILIAGMKAYFPASPAAVNRARGLFIKEEPLCVSRRTTHRHTPFDKITTCGGTSNPAAWNKCHFAAQAGIQVCQDIKAVDFQDYGNDTVLFRG
jgi:hypothetical protein